MTFRLVLLATLASGFLLLGTGCADKAASERSSLINQNDELKRELDAEKAARSTADARANAATAQVATLPPENTVRPPSMDPSGKPLDLSSSSKVSPPKPAPTGVRAGAGGEVIVDVLEIPGDVLFDSGKATLKPTSLKTLDGIAATLKKQYAGKTLRIEGHTDPTPVKGSGWDNNYDLGAARATAVLQYLVKKGIPEKSMYIASFGANSPKSTKNLALDRRVEIVVVQANK
jgi:flagellar motor protein MotB